MTQEDKKLLLADLSARLPYEVKVQHQHQDYLNEIQTIERITREYGIIETESVLGFVDDFKPYLRPMSSMTEEEENLFSTFRTQIRAMNNYNDFAKECNKLIDWLNAHHFDYRGLIEKGLGIKAPKGMYKEEQQ